VIYVCDLGSRRIAQIVEQWKMLIVTTQPSRQFSSRPDLTPGCMELEMKATEHVVSWREGIAALWRGDIEHCRESGQGSARGPVAEQPYRRLSRMMQMLH
jgi:hypothetical protein